jgi:dienelactone hydrolase
VAYCSKFPWGNTMHVVSVLHKITPVADVLGPKVRSTVEYMKNSGVEKIGTIGFCWSVLF